MNTQPVKPKNKGGRPLGSMTRLAQTAIDNARASGELPHEFLLRMSRGLAIFREVIDPKSGKASMVQEVYGLEERKDAAKAAAPYFAPKISTVEVINGVQDHELDAIIAQLAQETGLDLGTSGESTEDATPEPTRRRARLNEEE